MLAPIRFRNERWPMYDTKTVLASIDHNAVYILALCGAAMLCNYIYFIEAAVRGFRDKAYPFSVFSTLFWLSGDGSVVLNYDVAFHVINHWYIKLFWVALVFTVMFELLYLYMILRFGRKELAPDMQQGPFVASVLGALVVMFFTYSFIKARIGDALVIDYFCLANLAGPMFNWYLIIRRGTRIATSTRIWVSYTLLVVFWSTALTLFFGSPFNSPEYLMLCALAIAASIAVTMKVRSLPAASDSARGEPDSALEDNARAWRPRTPEATHAASRPAH
jgi:hypothetical protein